MAKVFVYWNLWEGGPADYLTEMEKAGELTVLNSYRIILGSQRSDVPNEEFRKKVLERASLPLDVVEADVKDAEALRNLYPANVLITEREP
ncbi:MAG: hypothetical protein ACE5FW_02480, partial [Candidatus Aenigmatarchaeota archaeon]